LIVGYLDVAGVAGT